jgi:hypothetical protein
MLETPARPSVLSAVAQPLALPTNNTLHDNKRKVDQAALLLWFDQQSGV